MTYFETHNISNFITKHEINAINAKPDLSAKKYIGVAKDGQPIRAGSTGALVKVALSALYQHNRTTTYAYKVLILECLMSPISISIVIPNYNHGHYLPKAVTHAINQTEPADEIIIIDDGSTDNSLEVIGDLIRQFPQIKLLQNQGNQGVLYTINRGLREAASTHVLMAAADDWIEPTLIENAKRQLALYPTSGLWSSNSWIAFEQAPEKKIPARMLYPCGASQAHCFLSPEQAQKKLLQIDSWFMGNTLVLNRQLALQENGYMPELQSFTDNFLYRVLVAKHGCCFSTQRLGTWQICKNSYANTFNKQAEQQLNVLREVIQLMQQQYANIFTPKLIARTDKRMRFNLARTIWNQQQGRVTTELKNILQQNFACKKIALLSIVALTVAGKVPKIGMYLGQVILFVMLRPFDLSNQIKLLSILKSARLPAS